MDTSILAEQLAQTTLNASEITALTAYLQQKLQIASPAAVWSDFTRSGFVTYAFEVHWIVFTSLYPDWRQQPNLAFAWLPDEETVHQTKLWQLMQTLDMESVDAFYQWSITHQLAFIELMIETLQVQFKQPPQDIYCLDQGVEQINWLPAAKLNIVDSCFQQTATHTALIYPGAEGLEKMTYGQLLNLVDQIAASLKTAGFKANDAIAIIMPLHPIAVACYLAVIKIGAVVLSIADSFSTDEIAARLKIGHAQGILTQNETHWDGKTFPLYTKLTEIANAPRMVVYDAMHATLRSQDIPWDNFLGHEALYESHTVDPMTAINILFSSGTTANPKAIPWDHTTPIKAAMDACLHHNLHANDVIAWPTSLGWMMGPWLIFAGLMNGATLALYTDSPRNKAFGDFVAAAKVTVLGVVPTLVAAWRQSHCMTACDWSAIRAFSSTGECSNQYDMLYLMSLAGYKPVIEYCGGTEIGGAYLSSTLLQANAPATFSTPTMGTQITILNEQGHAASVGEVAIMPPALGLSTRLLNADHHAVYYHNMPTQDGIALRRHGDAIKQYENGYYAIQGRSDDAMNLGGVKVSSAEIERVLENIPSVLETAAIAIAPAAGGPSQLVIFIVCDKPLAVASLKKGMQQRINQHLNPLFKIHDVVVVPSLPKTASNKIMRRKLREAYLRRE